MSLCAGIVSDVHAKLSDSNVYHTLLIKLSDEFVAA